MTRRSTLHYDLLERLDSATDAAGNITRYEYDAVGNRTAIVNPLNKRWIYSYDAKNRLISRTDPLGHTRLYVYDRSDQLTSAKSPLGKSVQYSYTKRGEKASVTKPNGDVINYAYDSNGHLVKLTDARGNSLSYSYDAAGRLISRTDALGRTSTTTYDLAGNVVSKTDRFGRQTTFAYDPLNRLIGTNYADATVSYTYNSAGQITDKSDSSGGTIHWDYDQSGRRTSEVTPQATVSYAYNQAGQITSAGVQGRPATQYQYDTFGRLSTISLGNRTFTFQYDAANRRVSISRPNGITTSYTHDDDNRLTHISHAAAGGALLEDLAYSFDDDGHISSIQSANNHTLLPGTVTVNPADAQNRIPQFGATLLSYDDQGNLVESVAGQSQTTYNWDARGRLASAQLPDGRLIQYSYDPMGRLSNRSVSGQQTSYVYSGSEPVFRQDPLGNTLDYVNGLVGPEKLLQSGASGDLYFLQDHEFNVLSITSATGGVVEQEAYEPFGNTTGSAITEFGFIGERFDADAHLVNLNARFYDPVLQRFITEDPIGTLGGLNVFAYSANDPINAFDPSGLYWCGDDWLVCASNISAGAGDKLSFGFTNWVRDKMGTNDVVDKCGLGYQVGGYLGDTVSYSIMALSVVGPLAEAGAAAEGIEAAEAAETEAGLATDLEEAADACALCFPAGTPIHTKRGLVPIEKMRVGDEVLSRSPSGKLEYKKVLALTPPHADNLLEIRVEGEKTPLQPSPKHPFWVKRRSSSEQWVPAGRIQVGDSVLTAKGLWQKVQAVAALTGQQTVYNFEVEDNHDYFVGTSGVLVHNATPCDIAREAAQGFENGECQQCADAIEQALEDAGQSGERISINTGDPIHNGNIFSDIARENISTNGIHEAVEVDGMVFDNITPNGLPKADWINSLKTAFGNITDFIK